MPCCSIGDSRVLIKPFTNVFSEYSVLGFIFSFVILLQANVTMAIPRHAFKHVLLMFKYIKNIDLFAKMFKYYFVQYIIEKIF